LKNAGGEPQEWDAEMEQAKDLEAEFEMLIFDMKDIVHAKVGALELTEKEGEVLINMIEDRLLYNQGGWDTSGCSF
jgi:hypothetical protein